MQEFLPHPLPHPPHVDKRSKLSRLGIFKESAGTQNGPELPGPHVKMALNKKTSQEHVLVFCGRRRGSRYCNVMLDIMAGGRMGLQLLSVRQRDGACTDDTGQSNHLSYLPDMFFFALDSTPKNLIMMDLTAPTRIL